MTKRWNTDAVLWGSFVYELHMQLSRRTLWVTALLFGMGLLGLGAGSAVEGMPELLTYPSTTPLLKVIVQWTVVINLTYPLALGPLLADRLARERHLRADELLAALPGSLFARLAGKYLGSIAATLVPCLAIYAIGVGCILYHSHDLTTLPLAAAVFAALTLPGALFLGAWSIALPCVLPVPLYQFLFIGYWLWGNLLPPDGGIPTLNGTLLSPVGSFACRGLFGVGLVATSCPPVLGAATPVTAMQSIALLVLLAILALSANWAYLRYRAARQ